MAADVVVVVPDAAVQDDEVVIVRGLDQVDRVRVDRHERSGSSTGIGLLLNGMRFGGLRRLAAREGPRSAEDRARSFFRVQSGIGSERDPLAIDLHTGDQRVS